MPAGAGSDSGGGRGDMVGVGGDPPVVEGEQQFGVARLVDDVADQLLDRHPAQLPVGIGVQLDVLDAEDRRGRLQLGGSPLPERSCRSIVEGGGLPVGEAQHPDPGRLVDEGGQHAACTEGLVVGVGEHREQLRNPRQAGGRWTRRYHGTRPAGLEDPGRPSHPVTRARPR